MENIRQYTNISVVYDAFVQVVAIEAVMSVIGIFAPSTCNLNNITLDHMKMYIAFAGDTDFFDDESATTGTEGLDGVKVDNFKHQKIVSLSFLSYLGSCRIQTIENNFCLLPTQLGEKVETLQCSCIQSGSQCPHVINLACYDGHTCLSHLRFGSQIASVLRTIVPVTGLRSPTSPSKSKAIPKFIPSVFHDVHSRMSASEFSLTAYLCAELGDTIDFSSLGLISLIVFSIQSIGVQCASMKKWRTTFFRRVKLAGPVKSGHCFFLLYLIPQRVTSALCT